MANEIATEGILRIVFSDRRQTKRPVIWESHTAKLDASTEKINQVFVPAIQAYADEDDIIFLEFIPTANVTLDENSDIRIPARYLNKANPQAGAVDTTLTGGDFGLTAAVACVAGVPNVIGKMTVAAQEVWAIGNGLSANSQIYVDLKNVA